VFTGDHTELDTRHEELFFVASGRAAIRVAGETVDAPAGTFVHVPDPGVMRGATALEAGTVLIAVGGEPGKAFEVSLWERRDAGDA
jgi:quercetin dioxygenase-like cupin family protein